MMSLTALHDGAQRTAVMTTRKVHISGNLARAAVRAGAQTSLEDLVMIEYDEQRSHGERRSHSSLVVALSAFAALVFACPGCSNGTDSAATEISDSDSMQAESRAGEEGDSRGVDSDDRGTGQAALAAADADADYRSDAPPADRTFKKEQLEQMVAPLALHPDQLLMQILMAATYPVEVVEADAWMKDHRGLQGKQLDAAVRERNWEESVQSLTHFPQVLSQLAADQDWTEDLGDAFLAQKDELLNAVQTMRLRACELGSLKTTAEQQVIIEPAPQAQAPRAEPARAPSTRIVRIVPTDPAIVHVPVYSPVVVYGPPPPVIYYPRIVAYSAGYVSTDAVISFGIGLSVGAMLWGDLDWHNHNVYRRRYSGGYLDDRRGYQVSERELWRHDNGHRRGRAYRSAHARREYENDDTQRSRPGNPPMWPARPDSDNRSEGREPSRDGGGDKRGGPPSHGKAFGKPGGSPPHGKAPDKHEGPPSHGMKSDPRASSPQHGKSSQHPSSGSRGSQQRGKSTGGSKGKQGSNH